MEPDELKNLADAQFARTTFLNNLKETYDSKLTVAHRGGTFVAKPELIAFLNSWGEEEIHVEDVYNNPILANRKELLEQVKLAYRQASVHWASEVQRVNMIQRPTDV
jgi:hypothetical protein